MTTSDLFQTEVLLGVGVHLKSSDHKFSINILCFADVNNHLSGMKEPDISN